MRCVGRLILFHNFSRFLRSIQLSKGKSAVDGKYISGIVCDLLIDAAGVKIDLLCVDQFPLGAREYFDGDVLAWMFAAPLGMAEHDQRSSRYDPMVIGRCITVSVPFLH